jgi:hypothetical protein
LNEEPDAAASGCAFVLAAVLLAMLVLFGLYIAWGQIP